MVKVAVRNGMVFPLEPKRKADCGTLMLSFGSSPMPDLSSVAWMVLFDA